MLMIHRNCCENHESPEVAGREIIGEPCRYVLRRAGIPFPVRPSVDGKPDIIIPGEKEYRDSAYPTKKLLVVEVKTTCKDRWRQVLNEGKRVPEKHIITTQQGISGNQLDERVKPM